MKWRIILKIKGQYLTRFEFGTFDELMGKYGGKVVSIRRDE